MTVKLVEDTIDKNDIDALCKWLQQDIIPRLTKGPLTEEFEKKYSDWLGTKYSVFVNSGSSALLLMLYSLIELKKLQKKDKVVIPALAWATDLAPVIQFDLTPVICDINLSDLSVDLRHLEHIFYTEQPKALMLVSVLGLVPNMDEIIRLCKKYNVILLEDCCESLGSTYKDQKLGTFGLMSCTSGYAGHHMSVSPDTLVPYIYNNQFYIEKVSRIYDIFSAKPEDIKVLSFDSTTNETLYTSPSNIIKHELKTSQNIIRLTLRNNRKVDITEDHSVFGLEFGTCEIKPLQGTELKIGDHIAVPDKLKNPNLELDLDFLGFCRNYKDQFFVINYDKELLKQVPGSWKNGRPTKQTRQKENYRYREVLPIEYLTSQNDNERIALKNTPKDYYIPTKYKITPDLCRLIGYFIAEGSFKDTTGLSFSFHRDEVEYHNDVYNIFKDIFGITAKIRPVANAKCTVVAVESATINFFFREFLGIKSGAVNKRIPGFIWHSSRECQLAYLYGHWAGDGTTDKDRISIASASDLLINDTSYLCTMLGFHGGISQTNKPKKFKIVNNKHNSFTKGNKSFRMNNVILYPEGRIVESFNKNNPRPTKSSLRKQLTFDVDFYSEKDKKFVKCSFIDIKKNRQGIFKKLAGSEKLLNGDLTLLEITNIEIIKPDYKHVYDFSVPQYENFIGGWQPICLHNSTLEGGIISTNDPMIYNMLKMLRSHGWDRDLDDDSKKFLREKYNVNDFEAMYTFYVPGFNLRSTDLQAFIGLRQLDKIDSYVEKRNKNYNLYRRLIVNPYWQQHDLHGFVSNFAYPMIHPRRDEIVAALKEHDIEVRPLICGSMGMQPMYTREHGKTDLANASIVDKYGFYIPNHPNLSEQQIRIICMVINNYTRGQ